MKTYTALGALWVAFCGSAEAQCPLPAGTTFSPAGGGNAVDVSRDTAVVGAPEATSKGEAYIHERDRGGPGAWGRVAVLVASNGTTSAEFGFSVALDGDRAVVGAPSQGNQVLGAAYVFERDAGGPDQWGEVAVIDPNFSESFGYSVALWGDTVLVGAPDAGFLPAGAAYIFERTSGGRWTPTIRFLAPVPGLFDSFGFDVALHEDTAAVSEPQDGKGWFPGSVFLFERDEGGAGSWGKVQRIRASDKGDGDWFGQSIDLVDDTIVVGALRHDHGGLESSGAAYVYERDLGGPDNWGERVELVPAGLAAGDSFGLSVAHDGDAVLVGEDAPSSTRAVHLFERHAGGPDVWRETGSLPGGGAFGQGLTLEATTALVGNPALGETYAYELALTQAFTSYCTAGTSASGCRPALSACGVSSTTASAGFQLQAGGVEGAQEAIFFFGSSTRLAAPWGNGTSFLCIAPPVSRGGLMQSSGTTGSCDGSFSLELNARWCPTCPKSHQNPGAGAVVQAQLWYRDPWNTSNRTTSLSDAIEFTVGP